MVSQKPQSQNVGPIVGGALGGLLLIASLTLLLYCTLIRPRKHNRIVHRPPLTRAVPNRAPPSLNYLVTPFVPPKMPSPVAEGAPHPYIRTKDTRNTTSEQVSESDDPFARQDQRAAVTLPRSKASVPVKSVSLTINIPRESKGQSDRSR
ncbi:hypothetical protein BJ165DRAFT_1490217 [Panaeolus papilionaceus]|nr:hypothetical protein BJ165DRAFT_1490217 [Panaeolus papilionaceus]